METKNKAAVSLGRLGGNATNKKYGKQHYSNAGKLGMAKRWSGHIKKTGNEKVEILFKCKSCGGFFKTTENLLADLKTCPKCNSPLN